MPGSRWQGDDECPYDDYDGQQDWAQGQHEAMRQSLSETVAEGITQAEQFSANCHVTPEMRQMEYRGEVAAFAGAEADNVPVMSTEESLTVIGECHRDAVEEVLSLRQQCAAKDTEIAQLTKLLGTATVFDIPGDDGTIEWRIQGFRSWWYIISLGVKRNNQFDHECFVSADEARRALAALEGNE